MKKNLLTKEDKIKIGIYTYDVLTALGDFEFYNEEKKTYEGGYIEYELHQKNSQTINPTHILRIYEADENNAFLIRLKIPTKSSNTIYAEKEVIKIKDIKKIK